MKNAIIWTAAAILLLIIAALTPFKTYTVTIVKDQITENRPFAGVINDEYVGTEVCCEYWMVPQDCPDTAYYTKTISLIGTTIKIKDITPAQ